MGAAESRRCGLETHDNEWLRLEVATVEADLEMRSVGGEKFTGHLGCMQFRRGREFPEMISSQWVITRAGKSAFYMGGGKRGAAWVITWR